MAIEELSPREAQRRAERGVRLIDVREEYERAAGMAEGAVGVAKSALEAAPREHIPRPGDEVILICQSGNRSLRAAQALAEQGYPNIASVTGGTGRWHEQGLPMSAPTAGFDADFHERYSRHLLLPEIGLEGQERLQSSRVLLLGAGGLGSPAAYYLAAAGVGTLRIADPDVVDRSNLQRQILHTEASIGSPKVASATDRLTSLNPRTTVEAVAEFVDSTNVESLLADVDVVIDGADNFPIRYLLNDACVKLGKPLVYGAVHRFEGQVSVFDAGRHRGEHPCYRCLFPEPPPPEFAPNCSEAGVLGILPGVVGLLEATEAIKLLLGVGEPLRGRLLHFDAMGMRFRETRLGPDPDCPLCAPGREFPGYIDYAAFCAGAEDQSAPAPKNSDSA